MKIYVNEKIKGTGYGSADYPFKHIQDAANVAMPGDEVIVYPGTYRENVDPKNAGTEGRQIIYRSTVKNAAVITGAERIQDWEDKGGDVWETRISNDIFGDYNPYTTLVSGDWFIATFIAHTGEVYLNGKAMYEVTDVQNVHDPVVDNDSWDPDFSVYTWYTEQDRNNDQTVIIANFHGSDPNKENVEINVRENCFYPQEEGIGHITLSGFRICKAATQWAPPTAYQEGMVGPHWSKGWIIEDCEISDSKCSGISLGKYLQPDNDNKWLKTKYKDGTQTERDCICEAQTEGWNKENIGSHLIKHCNIHDCGQTGIVGHLGGVFSVIEDNEIHHINNRHNLAGAEIGGIKMHAAIDVIIRRNHIHHCTRGIWLDWQAQGTRVSQNLMHDNTLPKEIKPTKENIGPAGEDLFVEVSHGPTLIDNNIFISQFSLKLCAQGLALVNNLIAGSLSAVGYGVNNGTKSRISPRYTPYHMKHRTEIAGFMTILHGDVRFYNNIFVQQKMENGIQDICRQVAEKANGWSDMNILSGTFPYDICPSFDEWKAEFDGYCGMGSDPSDRYYDPLPVWTGGNVFCNGAKPMKREIGHKVIYKDTDISLRKTDDGYYLVTDLYDKPADIAEEYAQDQPEDYFGSENGKPDKPGMSSRIISSETLGTAFEPEERFENPDGSDIVFDTDFLGNKRNEDIIAGPFAENSVKDAGGAGIKVW